MHLSISERQLSEYLCKQLNVMIPDGSPVKTKNVSRITSLVIPKIQFCFSHINISSFRTDGKAYFNHLNTDQYCMFLYKMSFEAFATFDDEELASKIYLLNKMMHAIDVFYEVRLPDIFLFVHPVGTVLGRASYSDFLIVYQGCAVGSNKDIFPLIGEYVTLHPHSKILGDCEISENCAIATGSLLLDKNLPSNTTFIGDPSKHRVLKKKTQNIVWI